MMITFAVKSVPGSFDSPSLAQDDTHFQPLCLMFIPADVKHIPKVNAFIPRFISGTIPGFGRSASARVNLP